MPSGRAARIVAGAGAALAGRSALDWVAGAARLGVPLMLIGSSPADRRRLARAAHAVAQRPGILVTGAPASVLPVGSTVLLDVADEAAREAAEPVVEAITDDGEPWLLVAAPTPMLAPAAFGADTATTRLSVPPLGAETMVPAALDFLGDFPDATLADAAAAWLVEHAAALDRVSLARLLRGALLLRGPDGAIEARHLSAASAGVAAEAESPAPAAAPPMLTAEAERLEYVLAELAHELRNPLVTLKTVTEHLDDLAEDAELRARFRTLGGEAVERMDDLLENLVTYGRLGVPAPRTVALGALLETAVREAGPVLGSRRLALRAVPDDASCWADPEHLGYALRNLLIGVAQTAHPEGELQVDASLNGVVCLRFAAAEDASLLQSLISSEAAPVLYDPAYLPLPLSLARAVLEKTGGRLQVGPADDGRTAIEVHLPASA